MKTKSDHTTHLAVATILGLAIGLMVGILLINYEVLPNEVDAQVYAAFSLIFAALAYFIGNKILMVRK